MNRRQRDEAQAFEEAWQARAHTGRSALDSEVADLVACAEQLCRAAVVEPSAEFRASLRTQLMTEAATVLAPAPAGTRPARRRARPPVRVPSYAIRRRLAGATAAFVGAAGFVGMVSASAQALPGEMLYPVKRGVENVELAFHKDDAARGEFRLNQASERLAEARQLTDGGSPQAQGQVAGALDDFADQAKDGSGALFRAYGQSGSEQSITTVNDFSAAAAADLAVLSGRVPSDADESFRTAADTVNQLVAKASSLCSSCGAVDVADLTGAVTSLTSAPPATAPTSDPDTANKNDDTPPDAPASVSDPDPSIPIPDLTGGQAPSASTPSQGAPKLKDLTDPTVGALLGDEEQPGLVPSLLDGLLGGGQN